MPDRPVTLEPGVAGCQCRAARSSASVAPCLLVLVRLREAHLDQLHEVVEPIRYLLLGEFQLLDDAISHRRHVDFDRGL